MSRKPSKTSAHNHAQHGGDDHEHHDEHAHGTFNGYMTGFALSIILTAIPFWLVMGKPLDGMFETNLPVAVLLMVFAVVQMIVHMVYFLHMHPKSEGGWTMMALFFTLILVIIAMSGSMWVMYHLNSNMMPSHDMSAMDATGEAFIPSVTEVSGSVPVSGTVSVSATETKPLNVPRTVQE